MFSRFYIMIRGPLGLLDAYVLNNQYACIAAALQHTFGKRGSKAFVVQRLPPISFFLVSPLYLGIYTHSYYWFEDHIVLLIWEGNWSSTILSHWLRVGPNPVCDKIVRGHDLFI